MVELQIFKKKFINKNLIFVQMNILVTGGAGFIGSFIVDELIKKEHFVRIYDNLEQQVHLDKIPDYLNKNAEFIKCDMNDHDTLKKVIKNIDVIFHQAAAVGVGQSMYRIEKYTKANTLGTAVLLNILVNEEHDVKKLIVASSMSIYGEGSYKCERCGVVEPRLRTEDQMAKQEWELHCPACSSILLPIPTPETKNNDITSIYALTKKDQEQMCMLIGKAYSIPIVALRYFNVYGPRQSLSNPYTGVAAIFMGRLKNNKQPVIYEDGMQTRDFVSVHDVVNANLLAMEKNVANYEVFNVGTGNPITIVSVAETLSNIYGKNINPNVMYKFRKGDVRHCFADISKIKNKLDFKPRISFEQGMKELIDWSKSAKAIDKFDKVEEELKKYGLN